MDEFRISHDRYDEELVHYCGRCFSLRVIDVPVIADSGYCDECGSTDIMQCGIHEWEVLYRERYGVDYLERR